MAVHMFRVQIGRGKMSVSDLETRIDDWVASNAEWEADTSPHTLGERNTAIDGSGETYYGMDVRFELTNAKSNLLQKFTDKLKNKAAWYRIGYHQCAHDEETRTPCGWQDSAEWTAKDATIPTEVPTF